MNDPRLEFATEFLTQQGLKDVCLHPIAGDASFRHYFRLKDPLVPSLSRGILMDAPPEREDIRPFVAIGDYLAEHGFSAPAIHAVDFDNGFILLEDLGDDLYSTYLAANHALEEKRLYGHAVGVLLALQEISPPKTLPLRASPAYPLPNYSPERLLEEALLFTDYYLPLVREQATGKNIRAEFISLWQNLFSRLNSESPVFVMRDFHADNLIWLAARKEIEAPLERVGLLDFQDAVRGHRAYDLVSLLQDARRDVSEDLEKDMQVLFIERSGLDEGRFLQSYDLLGAQRNIKILGIFARLLVRDKKPDYLKFIPRVWQYLERNLRHPALKELNDWLSLQIPPSMRGEISQKR